MKVQYTFQGTGADLYLCLGFIPDYVQVLNAELSTGTRWEWYRNAGCAEIVKGIELAAADVAFDALAIGDKGIKIYDGGDLMTATNQTALTYAGAVYVRPDGRDYRLISTDAINPGDGSGGSITTWTLGNSGNRTGNFNANVVGTYVGEGSRIKIRPSRYAAFPEYDAMMIASISANTGSAANSVTLDRAVPSGEVVRIGPMFDMIAVPRGEVTQPGILLEFLTSEMGVSGDTHIIVAEKFA